MPTQPGTEYAVHASAVLKSYGKVSVLKGLDFAVPVGSVFGLIGPNGAGKTTTLKILMNILKADSGSIEVLGADSRTLGPEGLESIGYVSENQELPAWMNVRQLLSYLKPFYPAWDDGRARELVQSFALPEDRPLRQFSRGMWMKAALASSLAYRPKLLVMDEPFSGLDPLVREEFIEGLVEHAGETTILVSSHDLGEVESFATHIGYLDAGKLQFSEEMSSIRARFRQVDVVPEGPIPAADAAWPARWLRRDLKSVPGGVRFVESRYDESQTTTEIARVFGPCRKVAIETMPLRAIFVAVARNIGRVP